MRAWAPGRAVRAEQALSLERQMVGAVLAYLACLLRQCCVAWHAHACLCWLAHPSRGHGQEDKAVCTLRR